MFPDLFNSIHGYLKLWIVWHICIPRDGERNQQYKISQNDLKATLESDTSFEKKNTSQMC